jgi:hypothetical protein
LGKPHPVEKVLHLIFRLHWPRIAYDEYPDRMEPYCSRCNEIL